MGNFDFDSYYDDEDEQSNQAYKFGNKVENDLKDFQHRNPLISYSLLDLSITAYSFHQECFDFDDIKSYFSQLKKFSNLSIQQCIDKLGVDDHFRIDSNPRGKIKQLIERVAKKSLDSKTTPNIGHFALYTNPNEEVDLADSTLIHFVQQAKIRGIDLVYPKGNNDNSTPQIRLSELATKQIGYYVMNNSEAFEKWLEEEKIEHSSIGSGFTILGDVNIFDLGKRWGIYYNNNAPRP